MLFRSSDGQQLPILVEKTEKTGVQVDTIIGDAAYSGKDNLIMAKEKNIAVVAKLNEMITQGHVIAKSSLDDQFTYNKDADRYICPMGVLSSQGVERKDEREQSRNKNKTLRYRWSHRRCSICKLREECLLGATSKNINIRILSEEHQEQLEFQNTLEFRRLSKERYKIEAQNQIHFRT